ncbi:hypothetical protein IHE45_14G040200 [Dioscorea alata]|uniref:Uncharacterized protein n=1 Tax=Dioscorea alata TaxID=55571 RepID=A0ACB7UR92_DIOAL|nr:hypothetical protein IHE45_14G040200 [Dioscorea alata]
MERLISSSVLPARTALLKPRPLAAMKRGLSLVSLRSGLSPFRAVSSGEDGAPRSLAFPRFFSVPLLEIKAREGKAAAESAERRDLARFVTRKDASAAVTVLLSALVVAVILPILAPAAYAAIPFAAKTGGTLFKSELLSSAWTGFFAGCLHTLSGPDHLAALAPLSIGRTRVESAVVGALWGCGHDAGQMIFGLLFLLLKDRMFLVGTVLAMGSYTVFIGSCSQALKQRVPRITEKLTWAASLLAITMGVAILVSQFLGFSLY